MNVLFSLACAMAFGLLLTRAAKLVRLPNVTAYLIAGLLIGPYCLGLMPRDTLGTVDVISSIALGFIAFSIGGEFKISNMKLIGAKSIIITFFQALAAVLLVDATLLLLGFDPSVALTLGAIAAATAPAATLMVVRQYKANGPLTRTLLPVVAMDDAVGLAVFAVSIGLAKAFAGGNVTVTAMLLDPLREIVLSLLVGGVIGVLLSVGVRFFHSRANRLSLCVCAVLLGIALSQMWNLSSLLLCMMISAVYCNLGADTNRVFEGTDRWTPPLLMLFFVISGAELDLAVLPTVGLLGVAYLVARSLGKYFGSYLGALVTRADENIRKYLGITLLPQAGVAIGMAQVAMSALPGQGPQIRAVVLCATLVYELVGPLMTKKALQAAGEIEKGA
ncbi:MAG: cation:proton antiporter [Clostridia bacterium]|nr:cation:proton antiporter [Clostridia bacterium]